MKINTHLGFQGQCREAFTFYEKVLGGKITFVMTYGDSPIANEVPPEVRPLVMHSTLEVGENVLMGADGFGDHIQTPQGFSVSIQLNDAAEGGRIFNALAEGGTVTMPYEKTFWSDGFGMVTDRFGIPWMINSASAS